ncbi:hypothetical protein STAN_0363 [Streptomyces sp. CBMAI 2042]|nr:hypothetical protein STAN_0363 [Streptomyces sp. CBMAI 2042]
MSPGLRAVRAMTIEHLKEQQ